MHFYCIFHLKVLLLIIYSNAVEFGIDRPPGSFGHGWSVYNSRSQNLQEFRAGAKFSDDLPIQRENSGLSCDVYVRASSKYLFVHSELQPRHRSLNSLELNEKNAVLCDDHTVWPPARLHLPTYDGKTQRTRAHKLLTDLSRPLAFHQDLPAVYQAAL